MSSELSADAKFEIGHVLFIDIVGYSKVLIHEQSEQLQTLNEIVRGTEQFRLAGAAGKLLRLPTGDVIASIYVALGQKMKRFGGWSMASNNTPRCSISAPSFDRSVPIRASLISYAGPELIRRKLLPGKTKSESERIFRRA